ncbi:hypothetical protein FB446DRAFT_38163 [Lentinula raphanica]|nr:hypothetical protein FB446DRAFT_38163 [Lentinula raphanica]
MRILCSWTLVFQITLVWSLLPTETPGIPPFSFFFGDSQLPKPPVLPQSSSSSLPHETSTETPSTTSTSHSSLPATSKHLSSNPQSTKSTSSTLTSLSMPSLGNVPVVTASTNSCAVISVTNTSE